MKGTSAFGRSELEHSISKCQLSRRAYILQLDIEFSMEEEDKQPHLQQEMAREQIITIIHNVFSAPSQQAQREAEDTLMTLFHQPGFLETLLLLLVDEGPMPRRSQFEKATAVLIKKFSYEYSKKEGDKSKFIETLFHLILCDKIGFTTKDILGTALEYQFNEDQDDRYRKAVVEKTISLLESPEESNKLQGIMIICIAYLNSLVDLEAQIEFFLLSIGNIHFGAINLLKQISQLSLEQWVYRDKQIMPKIAKLFEYIETAIERMIDEQDYFSNELQNVRKNDFLIAILENYLQLFNNNGSVISLAYPQINEIKRVMIDVVGLLYTQYQCPVKIFNTLYITFLVECRYTDRDSTNQAILIRCTQILTMHLDHKFYYKVYADNLVQTILAIFMYSTTNKQEYEALNNSPEEFSDIAECYVAGDEGYYNLKVKAGIFVRVLALKVDEAMKHIMEILITIMTSTLDVSPQDSAIMSEVKSETSQFDIYGLKKQQKLETSFMLLSTLSKQITQRHDINQLVLAFFISQFDLLTKTTSVIVRLRLIRVISCYSISLYFPYVEGLTRTSRVFAVQGIRCFQKILQTNKFAELFGFLAKIMSSLVADVAITDKLMEVIVIKNFETMIKHSPQLYSAILKKLKDEFYANKNTNEHATIICFNLLYSLLSKESRKDELFLLQQLFYEISGHLQQSDNLHCLQKYDEKIVQIQEMILKKSSFVSEEADRFVKASIEHIQMFEKGTQYFRFYSLYIFNLTGCTYKLEPLFNAFWKEAQRRFHLFECGEQYSDGISYFCFLMSEIMANYCKINLSDQDLEFLLMATKKLPTDKKQYPLLVLFTYLYYNPTSVLNFLTRNNIYEGFLVEINTIQFNGTIPKRIYLLGLIKLMEIQKNQQHFTLLLVQCINNLKGKCRPRQAVDRKIEPRSRNFEEEDKVLKKPQLKNEEQNDNELVNLFVRFHHPFNTMSEFDQFKVICWQNAPNYEALSPDLRASLAAILETELVNDKPRIILRIRQ